MLGAPIPLEALYCITEDSPSLNFVRMYQIIGKIILYDYYFSIVHALSSQMYINRSHLRYAYKGE
jgi:hypothetical protein